MEDPPEPISTAASAEAREERYQRHYRSEDTRRALWVIASVSTVFMLAVVNDVRLFGTGRRFFELVAVRIATVASMGVSAALLVRSGARRTRDGAIALFLAVSVAAFVYTTLSRPPDYMGFGVATMFAASVFYLVLPGSWLIRTAGAASLSAATIWLALRSPMPLVERSPMIVVHVLTHVVGIPMTRSFERLRREGFFAQERAERLANAKSEFLATMSHELRTPMNAVLGLSDILVAAPMAGEQREMVKIIHQSARSLLVLLNDILDFSKIEAGRMTVRKTPFDVRQVVESAIDLVRRQAEEKSLALTTAVAPDVPTGLLGDAVRLRQVLVNLLSNAIKFTDRGKIAVSVDRGREVGSELDIAFTVADTGIGIGPDLLSKLFVPFEQGDQARVRHRGGTGLGLAICRRLAALMGGDIRVESEAGVGSKFELTIRTSQARVPRFVPAGDRGSAPPAEGLRILLAEDNPVNQYVALAMFDLLGCRPDVVENGREAVLAVSRKTYDIVFLDLRMPEMNGIEAAKEIQATLPKERCPPIVAMTASAFEDDRAACLAAGMVDFVSKPVELEDLRCALQRRFGRDRPSAPGAPAPASTATLSRDRLDKLRAIGDALFFAEMCATFRLDAPKRIAAAALASMEGNAETAEREVHTLKSQAASFGADRLAQLCASLEAAAYKGDLSVFPEGILGLSDELARVERALAREEEGDVPHATGTAPAPLERP